MMNKRMNKRIRDFLIGKERREKTAAELNTYLDKLETGLRFERKQPSEKTKNNEVNNYVIPSAFEKAMALHYNLVCKDKPNTTFSFIFGYKSNGIYLKLPKEYKKDPEGYLKLLEEFNYFMIIKDEEFNKFSNIIDFSTIRKYWKRRLQTTKSNKNRLQFYGKISRILYLSPTEKTIFYPSLIESLQNLFK